MTYLASEWFTCTECAEESAHEWHMLASPKPAKGCPNIALSVCQHCGYSVVWVNGQKVWPQAAAARSGSAPPESGRREAA